MNGAWRAGGCSAAATSGGSRAYKRDLSRAFPQNSAAPFRVDSGCARRNVWRRKRRSSAGSRRTTQQGSRLPPSASQMRLLDAENTSSRHRFGPSTFCHAERAGARIPGTPCHTFLGHVPGHLEFITTAVRAPDKPDGTVWLRCTARNCGKWNRFRVISVGPSPLSREQLS